MTSVGYCVITVPISIMFHVVNPNLEPAEKAMMIGYEVGVASAGVYITGILIAIAAPAAVIGGVCVVYTLVTLWAGGEVQKIYENN